MLILLLSSSGVVQLVGGLPPALLPLPTTLRPLPSAATAGGVASAAQADSDRPRR